MKRIFTLVMITLASIIPFGGCTDPTTAQIEEKIKMEDLMKESNRQVGMPNIVNFQEKKNMKMIMERRDSANAINYAYIFSPMLGKFIYLGKCIGYPIPYAAQFTSPDMLTWSAYKTHKDQAGWNLLEGTVAQADPNGLYMPSSAEASWIMLVNPKTNIPEPAYIEERVSVFSDLLDTDMVINY
jgi:hypothetical protein